jgi:hypothetical protein
MDSVSILCCVGNRETRCGFLGSATRRAANKQAVGAQQACLYVNKFLLCRVRGDVERAVDVSALELSYFLETFVCNAPLFHIEQIQRWAHTDCGS